MQEVINKKDTNKMDVFDHAHDMLIAVASPINKAPLIESRRQIRYPEFAKVEPGSTLPQGDYVEPSWVG